MPDRGTWMVMTLILRVCLVLLFAGGPGDWTPPSLRADSKTASVPKARRPDELSIIPVLPRLIDRKFPARAEAAAGLPAAVSQIPPGCTRIDWAQSRWRAASGQPRRAQTFLRKK